jgi:SNF2 family DNA or RNA helicase
MLRQTTFNPGGTTCVTNSHHPTTAQTCTPKLRPSSGRISVDGDLLIVEFPYDPQKVIAIKTVPGHRWHRDARLWSVPRMHLRKLLAVFPDFIRAPELGPVADNLYAPLPDGRVLFQHQREAVEIMLSRDRLILADEMGLGKSLTALVAARAYRLPIIVICPASLIANWRREADNLKVEVAVHCWAKIPTPLTTDFVLIVDEAHYAQNLRARRTGRMLALAQSHLCQACFLLTGTPMRSGRPVNLFPLLRAIRHPLAKNRTAYELRYCEAGPTSWSKWDTSGAAHLDELHDKTRDTILRRTKDQCLDLPPKTRVLRQVALTSQAREAYRIRLDELWRDYWRRVAAGEISDAGDALVILVL